MVYDPEGMVCSQSPKVSFSLEGINWVTTEHLNWHRQVLVYRKQDISF